MRQLTGLRFESAAATLLLAIGLSASMWMLAEANRTAAIAKAREQQLEHLITLAQPNGSREVDDRSLASLGGLFAGQTVVWLHTSTGPVLSLAPVSEAGAL